MNEPTQTSPVKRRVRIIAALIVVLSVLWQVGTTEWRIHQLRAQGFGQVVVDSTRDHAYFPLAGGLIGATLFVLAGRAIKRLLSRPDS
ncbi:hypothetical protein [Sphingopyxis terrae]|uniref:hypothetical protein n=1 Tax=Sphingopyxis terrae TaxID=33052 RepID=UPI002A0CE5D7|nr:hypothetical protein [Sphingopyxis terrae]MDX8356857.1 hypothetical protein [Sphingopyxis terrae]